MIAMARGAARRRGLRVMMRRPRVAGLTLLIPSMVSGKPNEPSIAADRLKWRVTPFAFVLPHGVDRGHRPARIPHPAGITPDKTAQPPGQRRPSSGKRQQDLPTP